MRADVNFVPSTRFEPHPSSVIIPQTDSVNTTRVCNGNSSVNGSVGQQLRNVNLDHSMELVTPVSTSPKAPTPASIPSMHMVQYSESTEEPLFRRFDRARRAIPRQFDADTRDPGAWLNSIRGVASSNLLDDVYSKKLLFECLAEGIQEIFYTSHAYTSVTYGELIEWFTESFVVRKDINATMLEVESLTSDYRNVLFAKFLLTFVSILGPLGSAPVEQRNWLLLRKLPGYLGQMCRAEMSRFVTFADMTAWISGHEFYKNYTPLPEVSTSNPNSSHVNVVGDTLRNVKTGDPNPDKALLWKVDQLFEDIRQVVNALSNFPRGNSHNYSSGSRGGSNNYHSGRGNLYGYD